MTTFDKLGISKPILTALTACGYETPTLIQEKAIPAGLAGRDVLGSAQTGTGKTCAFGVPILQRLNKAGHKKDAIRALILTPTRELAIQIDENLKAYGKNLPLKEAVIFGGVGQGPQVDQIKKGIDILTATPGRLLDLCGQGLLDLAGIEIFVLDEADRMLDMGFIHDVRKVIKLLPEKKQTMFFSATLPPEIMDLVDSLLHDPAKVAAAPISSPVEVIRQEVCLVDRGNKTALLVQIMEEENVGSALVFTRTKHGADKVARDLNRKGVSAAAIHGNKSQTARQESLRKFKAGEIRALVATDIAARGLDIEDLSHVFNYNLSEVPETYIHRIGRTGRAGKGGTAISFCDYGELPMLKDIEKLLKKPIPRREHDFPMEVFEAPKKDKNGKVINADDAEARQAARERSAERKRQAAEKKAKAEPAEKPIPVAPAPPIQKKEKTRRPMPHGKQDREDLDVFLASQPKEAAPVTFIHRDPLEGDVIMDATARLLSAKPLYRYAKPPAQRRQEEKQEGQAQSKGKKRNRKKGKEVQPAPVETKAARKVKEKEQRKPAKHAAPAPKSKAKTEKPGRGRGRIPPKMDLPKSRVKDSTEQQSLMKPFYLNDD